MDGEQIHSMGDMVPHAEIDRFVERMDEMKEASPGISPAELARLPENIFTHWEFREALETCVDSSMDDLLACASPLPRALAMLDRRLGKRRFVRLMDIENEHPLVQRLYHLRAQAEGWPVASAAT